MFFPTYHLYVALISQRDQAVFILFTIVFAFFEIIWFLSRFRPTWVKPAIWIIGVGGYYASFLGLVSYIGSHS